MRFNLDLETDATRQKRRFERTKISLSVCQKVLEIETCVCKKDGLFVECDHPAGSQPKF